MVRRRAWPVGPAGTGRASVAARARPVGPAGTGRAGVAAARAWPVGPAGTGRASVAARPRGDTLVTFVFMFESASVLDGLNDEQRAAAAHPGGPLLVQIGRAHV